MDIKTRGIAFEIATKSLEVLGLKITAEKLWDLVEVILPILESGLTQRVPDGACTCEKNPLIKPVNGVCPVCKGTPHW